MIKNGSCSLVASSALLALSFTALGCSPSDGATESGGGSSADGGSTSVGGTSAVGGTFAAGGSTAAGGSLTGGGSGGSTSAGGGSSSGGGSGGSPVAANCEWPDGQAAVSLTYDDSIDTQLSIAGPALAAHNLKATFFVTDVRTNPDPWAALRTAGHELASHTFLHPCPTELEWVPEGRANEDYDLARMATELDETIAMLVSLGQPAPHTFAYPCGVTYVGNVGESYIPLIEERFLAARGTDGLIAGTSPDLTKVPAFFKTDDSAQMIETITQAQATGSWVVFGFHGIGGAATPTATHEALLQHLDDLRAELYVAPFGTVAACLAAKAP